MPQHPHTLMSIFSGWEGYQQSLVSAIAPLTRENLLYRPAADQRSVGEIAAHIAFGRIDWFHRMSAPGAVELVEEAAPYWKPWGAVDKSVEENAEDIVRWLNASWGMIEANLNRWTEDDLAWTYLQPYGGKTYTVSRQWVIWRILSHDIHHGGQLTVLLAAQGIDLPDLGHNGWHIVEVPEA